MYYYYDILLNFQDDGILYEFYEWEEKDDLNFVKKIPLFKVSSPILKDLLKYKVKFSEDFTNSIKEKTLLKTADKTLKNTFLICDTKDALAIELNEEGEVISRSRLMISDEINLNEIMFTMKESKLKYEKLKKYSKRTGIRQIDEIKKLIKCEINTLYESNNISKLKYLYYEWFNKTNDDIFDIYKKMNKALESDYDDNQKNIYNLIKKSYKVN